jgi:hypothetical protein
MSSAGAPPLVAALLTCMGTEQHPAIALPASHAETADMARHRDHGRRAQPLAASSDVTGSIPTPATSLDFGATGPAPHQSRRLPPALTPALRVLSFVTSSRVATTRLPTCRSINSRGYRFANQSIHQVVIDHGVCEVVEPCTSILLRAQPRDLYLLVELHVMY